MANTKRAGVKGGRLTAEAIRKLLSNESEVVVLDMLAQITVSSIALEMLMQGKRVKAKIVKGWK